MPEILQEAGSLEGLRSARELSPVSDNVLPYFKAYQSNPQLAANAIGNTYPAQFIADCAAARCRRSRGSSRRS